MNRKWFAGFVCVVFLSLAILAYAGAAPPSQPTSIFSPTSRPTSIFAPPSRLAPSSPAATQPYPSKELVEACRKTADELRPKLDKSFAVTVSPPFVLAGNMPLEYLKQYASGTVIRPADVMWKTYFRKRPQEPITILLFVDANSYAHWARKLFDDDAGISHFGYYKRGERTMVMNISTGGGTLIHELTHALMAADFPDVRDWFNEGLASLHEGCDIRPERIVGVVNWRLPALREAIAAGKLRPLADLLTKDDFYGEQKSLNYAQARYFCMYAQQKDLLEKLFRTLHDGAAKKLTDVQAVEAVFGKKIDQVEKDYLAWVKTLR